MKKSQGSYGYIKKQAITYGVMTLVMIAFSAMIFCIGYFVYDNKYIIITVLAVLGLLPGAKSCVSMIMYIKAEPTACPDALYKRLNVFDATDDKLLVGYDFFLTSPDKNYPICALLVKKGCLIGYTSQAKCDCNKAKEHIETYMKKNGISGINIKIFADEDKFYERFKQLCEEPSENTDSEKALFRLIHNLSL